MMARRINKKKTVSNNENSNKTVEQKTKKSNSKARRLKDVTNRNDSMKEKNGSENKSESRKSKKINKTDTLCKSSSNSNVESVAYEDEQSTKEIIEENSSNLPEKDDNETASFRDKGRRKSRRFKKPIKMESVGYKEEQGIAEIIQENSSNLQDKDDNETKLTESAKLEKLQLNMKCLVKLENYYIMESQSKIKTVEPEIEQCTKTTTEYSSNLPDKNEGIPVSLEGSGFRKPKSFKKPTKMESVGYEEEQGTSETILENSSTLPGTDDNEGSVHKKPKEKKVTFDETQHIKIITSNRHPMDKSNSNNMKEKNVSENKSESRKSKKINKTDTLSKSSSNTNVESVVYKEEQSTEEIIEENSSNLPYEYNNETASLEGIESRKSRWLIEPTQIESVGYEVPLQGTSGTILENSSTLSDIDNNDTILTESAKLEIVQNMNFLGNLEKLEDCMFRMSKSQNTTIKPEMKQCTETALECSSNLSDTDDNEIILTESAKLEMERLSNSNGKLKRKLSYVKVIVEELQNHLKRFKSS